MDTTTPTAFTLEAEPGTDIWRKPPAADVWNAPISHTASGPLKAFQSARATFWAEWTEQYDQGGLLLVPKRKSSAAAAAPPEKWVKTGVEYYRGAPQLSTVGCDRFADWSVGPLTAGVDPARGVTVEAVREGGGSGGKGRSVWVYQLLLDGDGEVAERIPLREICWILADEDEDGDGEEWLLEVSPLVARPEKKATEPLKVRFAEFRVQWRD
ncbi:hypothetical protein F4779DRAFT_561783 [Xylariaceae sp. FL0662B]|nr:hypothetical protein F4779DRAFT_561783 [Xylariaceae sp. FL0662B]